MKLSMRMEMHCETSTDVIFRTDTRGVTKGEVIALFPGVCDSYRYADQCAAYVHVGQHTSTVLSVAVAQSRPATEDEAAPLKAELERMGYRLRVVRRATNAHRRARKDQVTEATRYA